MSKSPKYPNTLYVGFLHDIRSRNNYGLRRYLTVGYWDPKASHRDFLNES